MYADNFRLRSKPLNERNGLLTGFLDSYFAEQNALVERPTASFDGKHWAKPPLAIATRPTELRYDPEHRTEPNKAAVKSSSVHVAFCI